MLTKERKSLILKNDFEKSVKTLPKRILKNFFGSVALLLCFVEYNVLK